MIAVYKTVEFRSLNSAKGGKLTGMRDDCAMKSQWREKFERGRACPRLLRPLNTGWPLKNWKPVNYIVGNRVLYQLMWFPKPNSLFIIINIMKLISIMKTLNALHSSASRFRLCCSLVFSKTNDSLHAYILSHTRILLHTHIPTIFPNKIMKEKF